MATLKATVLKRSKDGMYVVYIRVIHGRKKAYIRTTLMVDDKGLTRDKSEIRDSFVLEQTSRMITNYYHQLNQFDITTWTVHEIVDFLKTNKEDINFSRYATVYIEQMIERGQARTARNYKAALQSIENFAETEELMFSRLTSSFINRWIESLSSTARAKEMYPINIRQIFKAAEKEYNDIEQGIVRIKSPWSKVTIPTGDTPEKRSLAASIIRKFFNVVIPESRFKNPKAEYSQDIVKMVLCLAGINTVDLYYMKKKDYYNGILHYKRRKTCKSRTDEAYFEIKVPELIKPTFNKYLETDPASPYLFKFSRMWISYDSMNANINGGLKEIALMIDPSGSLRPSVYCFRHSWATIAQNECGASLSDVDFALNHSLNKLAKVYVRIDFSPAWKLNEKVIDFIFFTDKESKYTIEEGRAFDRFSIRNMINGQAFILGKQVAEIQDIGFHNVDEIQDKLVDLVKGRFPVNTRVQIKVTNTDKNQTQMYERILR